MQNYRNDFMIDQYEVKPEDYREHFVIFNKCTNPKRLPDFNPDDFLNYQVEFKKSLTIWAVLPVPEGRVWEIVRFSPCLRVVPNNFEVLPDG